MKIISIVISVMSLSILLIGNAGCSGEQKASLGQQFTLPINRTAVIDSENLSIKFDKVTTDSRCPKGVVCIWAGEARCQTYIKINNAGTTLTPLELVDQGGQVEGYSQAIWNSNGAAYNINFRLDPYPEAGKTINNSDYRLVMVIAKTS
jgi:hypothetical protein